MDCVTMKKIFYLAILLMILPLIVSANAIGDFYKDINVSLNCELCDPNDEPEVKFQLFADGEALEGKELVLNKNNEFKGVYEDLPVFKEGTFEEIKYEVKFFEDGEYRSLKPEEITYKKEKVSKWVQVMPEDIQPGHKYALFADNWNYEENGYGKFAIVNGLMQLEETNVVPDYKMIKGKKSFYSLTVNPETNSLWTITKVPSTDALYQGFEKYWVMTNFESKRLSLSGFDKGDWIDYVFRQTSKPDGWADADGSWNTTKVEFIPVEGEPGRFLITSHNIINDEVRGTKYMGVDHFYMIKAQAEEQYGGHFMLFEYLENEEVEQAYNIIISKVLCESESESQSQEEKNPNTKAGVIILAIPVISFIISLVVIIVLDKRKPQKLAE